MESYKPRAYSVNDFIQWDTKRELVLQPRFQRREVWTVYSANTRRRPWMAVENGFGSLVLSPVAGTIRSALPRLWLAPRRTSQVPDLSLGVSGCSCRCSCGWCRSCSSADATNAFGSLPSSNSWTCSSVSRAVADCS